MLFDSNDFVVAVAVIVVVVANFECVDFAALTAGIDVAVVHASFDDFVPEAAEIVVVVHDVDLR